MDLKIKGTVVAMNASRIVSGAYDVLLQITEVYGAKKSKTHLLYKRVVFEGVKSDNAFFVGDEITLNYNEEFGPRHFEAEVANSHKSFVDILPLLERIVYVI